MYAVNFLQPGIDVHIFSHDPLTAIRNTSKNVLEILEHVLRNFEKNLSVSAGCRKFESGNIYVENIRIRLSNMMVKYLMHTSSMLFL